MWSRDEKASVGSYLGARAAPCLPWGPGELCFCSGSEAEAGKVIFSVPGVSLEWRTEQSQELSTLLLQKTRD